MDEVGVDEVGMQSNSVGHQFLKHEVQLIFRNFVYY
jgi:hypothetical protein